jgi:hypothetical protein
MRPGDSAQVGDYTITYQQPTSFVDPVEQKISFGGILQVTRDGEKVATLHPSREYFSSTSGDPSAPISSFFGGEATSEVGRRESVSKDLWTAFQPDLSAYDDFIEREDQAFAKAAQRVGSDPAAQAQLSFDQGRIIRGISGAFLKKTPPADIRFNVNPFVIWLWVGAGIAVLGGLFAVWPGAEGRRRRVSDVYAARLARELSQS